VRQSLLIQEEKKTLSILQRTLCLLLAIAAFFCSRRIFGNEYAVGVLHADQQCERSVEVPFYKDDKARWGFWRACESQGNCAEYDNIEGAPKWSGITTIEGGPILLIQRPSGNLFKKTPMKQVHKYKYLSMVDHKWTATYIDNMFVIEVTGVDKHKYYLPAMALGGLVGLQAIRQSPWRAFLDPLLPKDHSYSKYLSFDREVKTKAHARRIVDGIREVTLRDPRLPHVESPEQSPPPAPRHLTRNSGMPGLESH